MNRPVFTRASLLMEDAAGVTVTSPEGAVVTVTPPEDPSSLDAPVPPVVNPAPPVEEGLADPAIDAFAQMLAEEGEATVVVDNAGGELSDDDEAPEVTVDTDQDAADAIADQTADAIDDSADEVAMQFENAEQRLMLADDIAARGLSASGLLMGRHLGLLTGASFDAMSAESLQVTPIVAGSRDCVMSQENLITSAAKSVADYGARAMSHSSGVVKRLLNMATKEEMTINRMLIGKMATPAAATSTAAQAHMAHVVSTARAAGRSFNMADVVKNAGKAAIRPRNAAVALALVAAIGGTAKLVQVCFKGAPAPGTAVAEMNGWFSKVRQQIAAIKWPFGKLMARDTSAHVATPSIRDRVGRLFCKDRPVTSASDAVKSAASYRIAAKEWTAGTLKSFKDSFTRAMAALKQSLSSGGEGFVRSISNGFKGAGGEGAAKATVVLSRGAYVASVFAVFALVATTVFFVVAGGCRLIRRQLEA